MQNSFYARTTNNYFHLLGNFLLSFVVFLLIVFGSFAEPESHMLVKSILFALLGAIVFVRSLNSPIFIIYFYTACAVINGISFLVNPYHLENKAIFSNFFILMGNTRIYIPDMLLLIGFSVLVLTLIMHSKVSVSNLFQSKISIFVIAFIAVGMIITLQSINLYGKSALGESRLVWFSALYFISSVFFHSEEDILRFFSFFVKMTFVRAIINISTIFIRPEYLDYQKPFGSGTDAAYFGISLLLILVLGQLCINNNLLRKSMVLIFSLSILLIASRSSILALFLAFFAYFLTQKRLSLRHIVVNVLIFTAIAIPAIYILLKVPAIQAYLTDRFMPLFQDPESDPTGSWRLLGWAFALVSIQAHPIAGVGFGSYAERFIAGEWLRLSLHNAYLDILYSMGMMGLVPFCFVLGSAVSMTYKRVISVIKGENKKLSLCLLLIIVNLAFFISLNAEMTYGLSGTLLWIFVGMVPVITKKGRGLRGWQMSKTIIKGEKL